MYDIDFYEDANGYSDIRDHLDTLCFSAGTSKDARIQYKQIIRYIQLLQENGTNLPTEVTKYLGKDIWELRPGGNRIFYFFFDDETYVLLHHYRKKSKKTPTREIKRAVAEMQTYIARKEQRS